MDRDTMSFFRIPKSAATCPCCARHVRAAESCLPAERSKRTGFYKPRSLPTPVGQMMTIPDEFLASKAESRRLLSPRTHICKSLRGRHPITRARTSRQSPATIHRRGPLVHRHWPRRTSSGLQTLFYQRHRVRGQSWSLSRNFTPFRRRESHAAHCFRP